MLSDAALAALVMGSIAGCGFNSGGVGSGDGLTTADTSASSSDSTADATSTTTAPSTTATASTSGASAGTSVDTATGETTDTTGGKSLPGSCAEILANDPNTQSGVQFIAPPNTTMPVVPFRVYCDMEMANGGWMLVARSISGDHDPGGWGWGSMRGNVDDDSIPYSLGATAAGVEFDEVLVGNRSDGKVWGTHVYRMAVPPAFLSTYAQSGVSTIGVQTTLGDCTPSGGPENLHYAGHTADTYVYFFSDSDGYEPVGLTPTGFALPQTLCPCSCSGDLDTDQGMIMVR